MTTAIAFNGSVILEPGAKVKESAISVGGKVKVSDTARVDGSRIELNRELKIVGDDGKPVTLSASVGGKQLGEWMVSAILDEMRSCSVQGLNRQWKRPPAQ